MSGKNAGRYKPHAVDNQALALLGLPKHKWKGRHLLLALALDPTRPKVRRKLGVFASLR